MHKNLTLLILLFTFFCPELVSSSQKINLNRKGKIGVEANPIFSLRRQSGQSASFNFPSSKSRDIRLGLNTSIRYFVSDATFILAGAGISFGDYKNEYDDIIITENRTTFSLRGGVIRNFTLLHLGKSQIDLGLGFITNYSNLNWNSKVFDKQLMRNNGGNNGEIKNYSVHIALRPEWFINSKISIHTLLTSFSLSKTEYISNSSSSIPQTINALSFDPFQLSASTGVTFWFN